MDLKNEVKRLAKEFFNPYREIRRHLHANLGLSFKEYNTCTYVKKQLSYIGIRNIEFVAKTGLLISIEGGHGVDTVLLRADMDALPIQEKNEISYSSKNSGIMHACGHDVHIASLLLCAKILYEVRNIINGTIKLLFQLGEEIYLDGASFVIMEKEYKVLKNVSHIGQHVMPNLPVGKIGFKSRCFMASMDEISLKIIEKGGHSAMSEDTIDPILIALHIIITAQQLVSRMSSPKTPTVLSFVKIIGMGTYNIIPNEVIIEGTFRTLDIKWRKKAMKMLWI